MQFVSTMSWGWRLTKVGDPLGRATVLLGAMTVLFAISESLTVLGVWYGLLCAFACLCRDRSRSTRRPVDPPLPAAAGPPIRDRSDLVADDFAPYVGSIYDQDAYEGTDGGSKSIGPW